MFGYKGFKGINSTLVQFKRKSIPVSLEEKVFCINSTLVQFKQNILQNLWFKKFNSINSTLVQFKLKKVEINTLPENVVSIPLWFNSNLFLKDYGSVDTISINSTLVQFKLY